VLPHKKAGINATVSVSKDSTAGNVDLKIYNPSVKKKKGATIEIRKKSGYDFTHVLLLKDLLANILDRLMSGEELSSILSNTNVASKRNTVSSGLIKCDLCNYQTRLLSALKSHKTRIHNSDKFNFNCTICDFSSTSDENLKAHISEQPSNVVVDKFKCSNCNFEFATESNLKEHVELNQTLGFKRRKSDVTPGCFIFLNSWEREEKN